MYLALFLGSLFLLGLYLINVYNSLQELKHQVKKAWSNIDVLLKQRHDELPKLIETCKQYQQFESTTLQKIIEARAQVFTAREAQDIPAFSRAETELKAGLGQLFAVAEAYPELKANEQFQQLLNRITSLEEAISDRREYYNEAVTLYNVRTEQFPDMFFARFMKLKLQSLLEFSAPEKKDVDIRAVFNNQI